MICSACERREHYRCIDCLSGHSTHDCSCTCHDASTGPHGPEGHA